MDLRHLMKSCFSLQCRALHGGLILIATAAIVVATSTSSSAALLAPGAVLYPVPPGVLNGGASQAVNNAPVVAATFTGTLHSEVFLADPTNPFGLNALTFVYQVTNTTPVVGEIERLTVSDFSGFLTDAHYVANAGGFLTPTYIDRSIIAGPTVGFSFAKPPLGFGSLEQGQVSALMVVYTDAQKFATTTASLIDGSVGTVSSFAPSPLIPEPGSLVLAGFAGLAFLAYCRRRQ